MTDPWGTDDFFNSWFFLKLLNWKWSNLTIIIFCLISFSKWVLFQPPFFSKLNHFCLNEHIGLDLFPIWIPTIFLGIFVRRKAQKPSPWVLDRSRCHGRSGSRPRTTDDPSSAGKSPWHPGSAEELREVGVQKGRGSFFLGSKDLFAFQLQILWIFTRWWQFQIFMILNP